MRIRFHNREFAPGFFMTLSAAFFFGLFLTLGNWQLQRADLKRDIESRFVEQLQQPYQYLILNSELNESFAYRKIKLKGVYQKDQVILLDNQVNEGVAGYHILTPFFINGGQKAVLVNRGWVAAGADRKQFPSIKDPRVSEQVLGIVTIPTTEGYRLGQVEMGQSWPQRVPYIDLQKIQQGVSFELLPYVIWQAAEMDDYYVRNLKPVWSPPEKSEAYALQWFSFAFIVLILYVVLNFRKRVVGETNE